jgi:hypothetical protein
LYLLSVLKSTDYVSRLLKLPNKSKQNTFSFGLKNYKCIHKSNIPKV